MRAKSKVHAVIGVLLSLAAVVLFCSAFLGPELTQAKVLESLTKVLVATLMGVGALYALDSNERHEIDLEKLRGSISQLNSLVASEENLRSTLLAEAAKKYLEEQFEPRLKHLEVAAASRKRYAELVFEEDFRRRERRDAALMTLSRTLRATTRAFRALTKFRLSDGVPSEALVNILAQGLGAREAYLGAREELVILHAIDGEHEQLLRAYSKLLIDIIIDVRRTGSEPGSNEDDYGRVMSRNEQTLERLDENIGELLAVFLAPQQRQPPSLIKHGR